LQGQLQGLCTAALLLLSGGLLPTLLQLEGPPVVTCLVQPGEQPQTALQPLAGGPPPTALQALPLLALLPAMQGLEGLSSCTATVNAATVQVIFTLAFPLCSPGGNLTRPLMAVI